MSPAQGLYQQKTTSPENRLYQPKTVASAQRLYQPKTVSSAQGFYQTKPISHAQGWLQRKRIPPGNGWYRRKMTSSAQGLFQPKTISPGNSWYRPKTTSPAQELYQPLLQGLHHNYLIHLPMKGPPGNLNREDPSPPAVRSPVNLPLAGPPPSLYREPLTGLPLISSLRDIRNNLKNLKLKLKVNLAKARELVHSDAGHLPTVQPTGDQELNNDAAPPLHLTTLDPYTLGISHLFKKVSKYLKRNDREQFYLRRGNWYSS